MISWGIIGCGNVTEVKSGPAFSKVENSRLVAVMRRNGALAEDYAGRHNVPKFYDDADLLIRDPEVNAVYIATPPASHAEYAVKVIRARKPVYIEKPMALNHDQCELINREAERHGVPVFVAYYRRALPGFVKVRELVTSGEIGKPRFIQLQLFKPPTPEEMTGNLSWRVDPEISGGGHFFDLASHQLDYLDLLFGPVKEIKSVVLNQGGLYVAEDFVSAQFTFENNIAGTGTWCFNGSKESSRDVIEIIGEKGIIKFSTFTFDPIELENENGKQEFINERPEHVQYYLIDQIVKTLSGNSEAVSTGITAARTSRVMDEIVKEYYKDKRQK
jgi:predicted dehydrogenase